MIVFEQCVWSIKIKYMIYDINCSTIKILSSYNYKKLLISDELFSARFYLRKESQTQEAHMKIFPATLRALPNTIPFSLNRLCQIHIKVKNRIFLKSRQQSPVTVQNLFDCSHLLLARRASL